jgi:Flp pilus assembly secretin CpaC
MITRNAALFTSLVAALTLAGAVSSHANDTIEVVLDQAKVLHMPANTTTIIVGNPVIADVTMLRRTNQMVLTGKGYGETNMIALDADGNAIGESTVRVTGSTHGLIVQRGMTRETYSCNPRCQPTMNLGDDPRFMNGTVGQIRARATASGSR